MSCSTGKIVGSKTDYKKEFSKICIVGSGRGRIELLTNKQTFTYESEINKSKNLFQLVLDFPIVGEKEIAISLNPEIVNKVIKNSEITELLKEQIGGHAHNVRISKSIEEFFVFASDFLRYRQANVLPPHFSPSINEGHFILERTTASYRFVVDNFSPNEKFYERFVLKLFVKEIGSDPILTLFLVPQVCEK